MYQLQAKFRRILFGLLALVGTAAAVPTLLHAECYRVYRVITTTTYDRDGNIESMTTTYEYQYSYCTGGNIAG
jgi:hypothetical protein